MNRLDRCIANTDELARDNGEVLTDRSIVGAVVHQPAMSHGCVPGTLELLWRTKPQSLGQLTVPEPNGSTVSGSVFSVRDVDAEQHTLSADVHYRACLE
jgi:hypothetical protein